MVFFDIMKHGVVMGCISFRKTHNHEKLPYFLFKRHMGVDAIDPLRWWKGLTKKETQIKE